MSASRQKLAIFGATGSIGTSALNVLRASSHAVDQICLVALSANSDIETVTQLAIEWQPTTILIANATSIKTSDYRTLQKQYKGELVVGSEALVTFARMGDYDSLLVAISGSAALPIAWEVAKRGKRLLLANKEALVAGGELLMQKVRQTGAQIVPVDSEHSGLWQCLGQPFLPQPLTESVQRLEITASGGPFWNWSLAQIQKVTPEQACTHPNWSMGAKISVDSATMVNKALEIIEARWMFDIDHQHIDVLIHPQSLIHALVHFRNGSSLAQLSLPDMRVALTLALFGDAGVSCNIVSLQLQQLGQLVFHPLDSKRFRAIALVRGALTSGGDRCLCFDTANEIANAAFRNRRIDFGNILDCIENLLDTTERKVLTHYQDIRERQTELAELAEKVIQRMEA